MRLKSAEMMGRGIWEGYLERKERE